jgi:ribosomal protein L37AE/L43A
MAKSPVRVKIVIEENGKDIASEYIGHEVIKAAVCCRPRTVKKIAHTVWGCNKSDLTDGLEVLGGSRAVIQRVGDSL